MGAARGDSGRIALGFHTHTSARPSVCIPIKPHLAFARLAIYSTLNTHTHTHTHTYTHTHTHIHMLCKTVRICVCVCVSWWWWVWGFGSVSVCTCEDEEPNLCDSLALSNR